MECVRACVRACVRVTSRFEQVIAASLECAQQEDGSAYSLSSMQVTSLPAQTRRPKRQCCGQSIVPATEWAVCALQDHAGAVAVLKLCRANAVLLVPQFADLQSAARLDAFAVLDDQRPSLLLRRSPPQHARDPLKWLGWHHSAGHCTSESWRST